MNKTVSIAIVIALIGIAAEIVAIVLLAQERITTTIAMPLIVAGMFLAFVPVFVVARRTKR